MSLSFLFHSPNTAAGPSSGGNSLNKSEATPRLPHGDRVLRVRRRRECSRHRSRPPWRERFFDRLRAGPGARRASTHRRGTRCDVNRRGASVAGLASRGEVLLAPQGDLNPEPCGPNHDDLSGRCNEGSRTLHRAVVSCLLYPLSYIAVAVVVTSDAGTPGQQRCRVPVWL